MTPRRRARRSVRYTLRDARRAKSLTQDQLAAASGVDQTTISRLELANERGRRVDPAEETIAKLAPALDLTPESLKIILEECQ